MDDQQKAAELLRRAAEALLQSSTPTTSQPTTSHPPVPAQARSLFAPYRRSGQRRPSAAPFRSSTPVLWSHKFYCLAATNQESVPTKQEKKELFDAGLGEKRVTFVKDTSPENFKSKLLEVFPKLSDGGGFELLRSTPNSRSTLESMRFPMAGFTSAYLADESNLGSAMCFIRPIQQDLDLSPGDSNSQDALCGPEEACRSCGKLVTLGSLRAHLMECLNEVLDELPPPSKKKYEQVPVCQYACVSAGKDDSSTTKMTPNSSSDYEVPCPVCGKELPKTVIEIHASTCGESTMTVSTCGVRAANEKPSNIEKGSLEESIDDLAGKIKNGTWLINVLRSCFHKTVLEELTEAVDEDWEKNIKVKFVGEEGIDAGGLSREFYSILFKNSAIFEKMSFRIDSELLEKKVYQLMGKATARALIMGHPGPKCFHPFLAKFICFGQEPDFNEMTVEDVGREDVMKAIQELTSGNGDLDSLMEEHGTFLEQAGFRKCLTSNTVSVAAQALKRHFAFYHATGALMQFREGLQLLGVLQVLQNYPESTKFFTEATATAADIQEFYQPSYSLDSQEMKKKEELIVYNFAKFLKKAERGKLSTPWINIDDGTKEEVTITTGLILQALVGCEMLPRISSGLILIDHASLNLTTLNTCAPSITFSQTNVIQEYEEFENLFVRIIVESVGFGIE